MNYIYKIQKYIDYSMKFSKNKEITLQTHLGKLKKKEYVKSFQRANKDKEMIKISEEGIKDYLEMLKD